MRRRFNEGEYWRRTLDGEFIEERIGKPHKVAHKGVLKRHPEAQGITAEYRDRDGNTIAQVHYYIDRPGGDIIPDKRPDPKRLFEDDVLYSEEKAHRRLARLRTEYDDVRDSALYADAELIAGYSATNSQELKTNDTVVERLDRQESLSKYLHNRWMRVLSKITGSDERSG
jgi:hypothetical protein